VGFQVSSPPFVDLGVLTVADSTAAQPQKQSSDNKLPRLLIIIVVVVHAAIALTMKIVFFS
jgi:hypothetical protein